MIKRPLVWILCAYLIGMYLAWQGLPVVLLIILIVLLCLLIYFFMYQINIKLISRQDKFIWCLPLLLTLGFFSLRDQLTKPELYEAFGQETSCELSGSISMIVNKETGKALYLKNNTVSLPSGDRYLCEYIIVNCYTKQYNGKTPDVSITKNYLVGNRINVYGTLRKFSQAANPGQFNEKLYYQIENIDFKMTADSITVTDAGFSRFHAVLDRFKYKLINAYQSILPDKEAGTIIAMLLGEKYLLDDEIKQLYQMNGISHILAISGLHISLIGMFIYWLLKKLRLPVVYATLISILSIYAYGVLTNFSVSTNRAVVMMTVMLLGRLIGKTYDMLSSISLSALIILLQNPLQLLSAGFLLSYGAVLGIAIIFPSLKILFPAKNKLLDGLLISFSAQITTTPFILWYFYQFPTYSVLVNLIILPFVTILTLSSILAGIAGVLLRPLGLFLIGGSDYILNFYELICRVGAALPYNLITTGRPGLLRMIAYVALIILFIFFVRKNNKKYGIILPLAALGILLLPGKNTGLEVTMLDVGQGDAIYMEDSEGTTFLIDGGSADIKNVGTYRIQPFLLSKGCDTLDYVIMTHSDSDHISGLKELMETGRIKIHSLLLPAIGNKDKAYLELEALAKEKKLAIRYIAAGNYILDGGVRILCLHPSQGYKALSSNAYSTVLSVSYKDFDMLLTGDLQKDGEQKVLELLQNASVRNSYFPEKEIGENLVTDYDVLKVAHHGSKYSTLTDFLKIVRPELSLISCGRDNFYGHPHAELLSRLYDIRSNVKITYETGAVTVRTDGKRMKVISNKDR